MPEKPYQTETAIIITELMKINSVLRIEKIMLTSLVEKLMARQAVKA